MLPREEYEKDLKALGALLIESALPHHGEQLNAMVMQLLEGRPLADITDYLFGFYYLRTRDDIDPIIEENRSEGRGGTDQGDKTPLTVNQEVLQGVIDERCSRNSHHIALGQNFVGGILWKIPVHRAFLNHPEVLS